MFHTIGGQKDGSVGAIENCILAQVTEIAKRLLGGMYVVIKKVMFLCMQQLVDIVGSLEDSSECKLEVGLAKFLLLPSKAKGGFLSNSADNH